jgi:imidazolonepropionase-like amidohydrolase
LPVPARTNRRIEPGSLTSPFISPENLDHIEKGSVLIENGRIVSVERKTGAKKPAGATVVDGKGQFLIPGLIDSHVHLTSVPGMSFDQTESKPEMIKEYFKQLPRSYLFYGYTTLVDLAVVDPKVLEDFRRAPLHPDCMTVVNLCLLRMGIQCRFCRQQSASRFFRILYTILSRPPVFRPDTNPKITRPPQM